MTFSVDLQFCQTLYVSCFWFYIVFFIFAGASIQACRAAHRHILALEADKDIFDALIVPLMRSGAIAKPPPQQQIASIDLEEEEGPIQKVVRKSRFNK